MKIKIEIEHCITGSVLFEYESSGNTILKTLVKAAEEGAYLQGADLRGAYLQGADLRGAYLRGAYLQGADLRGAELQGADLQGADLQGAELLGADLRGAYLQGAYLQGAENKIAIKLANVFTGLYKYVCIPYITKKEEKRIKLGCYDRSLKEWESDFWNNPKEFPNNGTYESNSRLFAFNTCKEWFKLIENEKS